VRYWFSFAPYDLVFAFGSRSPKLAMCLSVTHFSTFWRSSDEMAFGTIEGRIYSLIGKHERRHKRGRQLHKHSDRG
jgi:hypothetical protein